MNRTELLLLKKAGSFEGIGGQFLKRVTKKLLPEGGTVATKTIKTLEKDTFAKLGPEKFAPQLISTKHMGDTFIPVEKSSGQIGRYVEDLQSHSGNFRLDRSQVFRHPKDLDVLGEEFETLAPRIKAGGNIKVAQIGVGNGEEGLSHLSGISQKLPPKASLKDSVALDLYDVRGAGEITVKSGVSNRIATNPRYAEYFSPPKAKGGEHEFKPEVQKVLKNSIAKSEQAGLLGKPIEITAPGAPEYDVVCCNNVFQHMGSRGLLIPERRSLTYYPSPNNRYVSKTETFPEFKENAKQILGMVKPGGLFIAHTPGMCKPEVSTDFLKGIELFDKHFTEIKPGIYRRNVSV